MAELGLSSDVPRTPGRRTETTRAIDPTANAIEPLANDPLETERLEIERLPAVDSLVTEPIVVTTIEIGPIEGNRVTDG